VFLRASSSTLARDFLFGGIYSLMRHGEHFIREIDEALSMASHVLSSVWSAVAPFVPPSAPPPAAPFSPPPPSSPRISPPSRTAFFLCNLVAAGLAVGAASPFNHIRNMKFCTPPEQPAKSGARILRDLCDECYEAFRRAENPSSPSPATVSLIRRSLAATGHLQNRLKIGVGTLRVAVGMAFGSQIYDICTTGYNN